MFQSRTSSTSSKLQTLVRLSPGRRGALSSFPHRRRHVRPTEPRWGAVPPLLLLDRAARGCPSRPVGREGLFLTWPDQEVRDVLETTHLLEAIERRSVDLAVHRAQRSPVGFHRSSDEAERQVLAAEARERAHRADAEDLSRPAVQVVHLDQADVKVDEDVFPRPAVVDLFERPPPQLLGRASSDGDLPFVRHRVNRLALGTGHVPVGKRVDEMAVGHQAADRGDMLFPLDVGQDRVPTSDQSRSGSAQI